MTTSTSHFGRLCTRSYRCLHVNATQCCACSCRDDIYSCGIVDFDCRDPACFDPAVVAELPDCAGDWARIGDGVCNADTNVPSCGYDGGDVSVCVGTPE